MMRRFVLAAAIVTLPLTAFAQIQSQIQTQTGARQSDCVQCVSVQSRSVQSDPVQSNCVQCGCVQCGSAQSGGIPTAGQNQNVPDFVPLTSTRPDTQSRDDAGNLR